MKLSKFIVSAIVGTSFMTLYSYIIAKKENKKFLEPQLLNELIDGSENLPDVNQPKTNPAGWIAHYGVGLLFIATYYVFWKKSLQKPGIAKGLFIGAASGILAILSWEIMFTLNKNPPKNDRLGYYRQLFIAHLIFSVTALYGYKLPDYIKRANNKQLLN